MPTDRHAEPIWVLLGARRGDNQQLLALAEAIDAPFRAIQLRFDTAPTLRPIVFASRASWQSDTPLGPPWPRLVLAAGRRSVAASRWIRRRSRGATRLVHVNRPWAPLDWFDLVVTTPAYGLPERANVLVRRLPMVPPPDRASALPAVLEARAAALPRPWTAVLIGGHSRPYAFDDAAVERLAGAVDESVRRAGGGAWLVESPRTPAPAIAALLERLAVPIARVTRADGREAYAHLLAAADRFVVTADSASMLAEALLSARPVQPVVLSRRPDWNWRLAAAWRASAERAPGSLAGRTFACLVGLGFLSTARDVDRVRLSLAAAGAFDTPGRALELADEDRRLTVQRIAALLKRS